MNRACCVAALVMLACMMAGGCSRSHDQLDARLAPLRVKYLLADEPADAVGVLDAREAIASQPDVVLVGQIPASPDPWTPGRALFLIADPASCSVDEAHDHECGDGCPFCSKKQESQSESLAVVQFVDDMGRVLPHDARQLLGVAANQLVVVRGKAKVDELGCLVVTASGLYVRR